MRDHPEDVLVDREGRERLHGVLDYNARGAGVAGRASASCWAARMGRPVRLHAVAVPAGGAWRPFGFNELRRRPVSGANGRAIRATRVDLDAWRAVRGEGLTALLRDLRAMTPSAA